MTETDASGADGSALFALPEGVLYLDCATQGPRLRAVDAAARRVLDAPSGAWIGGDGWRERIERVRALAAGLFDGEADAIALVPSAAYGLALAARNVPLWPGQSVLVLDNQFPSNLLPWRRRCAEVGGRLVSVARGDHPDWGMAVASALEADDDIAIMALPHAHWHDGALLDLDAIAALAQERRIALVLDLSQSLGAMPLRLAGWQPDFVVGVGYKWLLGPYGLAYLWCSPRWRGDGQPLEQGWMARDCDALWAPPGHAEGDYLTGARRYDADGTCDALRLAMAETALRQVLGWGVEQVSSQLQRVTAALDQALDQRGLGELRTPGHAPHLCGLRPPAARLQAVADALAAAGVVAATRGDCIRIAPYLHVGAGDMARVADTVAAAL